jgi:hypothetical protein
VRYFIHISEFGFEGYRYLPALAFLADDLIVWSPSGQQAQAAVQAGQSLIGPDDLLRLVESRRIRVVGRKKWLLDDESRRASKWAGAAWTDSFDGVIKSFAESDDDLPDTERRVLFADEEQGQDWAREEIERGSSRVKLVERLIEAPHALDPAKTVLLPGLAEKLVRLRSPEDRLRLALRDIRNHTLAGQEVHADIPVEPRAFREVVSDIASESSAGKSLPSVEPPTEINWRHLVALIEETRAPKSLSDVEGLLELKERPGVTDAIHGLLLYGDPRAQIQADLEAAPELESWWRVLLTGGSFPLSNALDMVAVLLGSFIELPTAAVPLTRLCFSVGEATERWTNREEEEETVVSYNGSVLPFLLAYGDATATFKRIGELKRRLRSGEIDLPF